MNIFRSKLIFDEQKFLFDVWLKAASGNKMPSRKSLSPCAFGPLLPFVSLVEFAPNLDLPKVRVIGSNLRDVFGNEPCQTLLTSGIEGSIDTINQVRDTKMPISGSTLINAIGRNNQSRFWLRLPLGDGETVDSIIGLDLTINGQRAPIWAMARTAM